MIISHTIYFVNRKNNIFIKKPMSRDIGSLKRVKFSGGFKHRFKCGYAFKYFGTCAVKLNTV